MADITFEDGGGNQRTVPEWATESTLQRLVTALTGKQSKEQQKKTEQAFRDLSDGLGDLGDNLEQAGKAFKNSSEQVGDRAGEFIGKVVDKTVGVALLTLGTAAAVTTASLTRLGTSLNTLSQSGLALSGNTIQQIASLNELGLSTDDVTKLMLENSQAFRSLGSTSTNQVIRSFLEITRQGNDLGMSLEDSIEFLGDELTLRTQLLNLGALDIKQRGRMSADIVQLGKDQLAFSKALGVSTSIQREFSQSVLGNNQMLMANMIRTSSESRAQLFTGLQGFLSGMRAMGGEVGGEIAEAVLEAASMGAIGFSDAAFGFVTVLPGLADNMQNVIADFEAGIIDGSEAAMAFTKELGNLSQGEKDRVFLLARAGDEQAKMMAKAIVQFETAAQRMEDQGTTIENVQEGFNAFNTILSKLRGAISSLTNNFMAGFGEGVGDVTDMMANFSNQIQRLLLQFFNMQTEVGDTSNGIQALGKKVGKGLNDFLVATISWVKGFLQAFDEDDSVMDKFGHIAKRAGEALVDGIINIIPWGEITAAIVGGFTAILIAMKLKTSILGGGFGAAAGGVGGAGIGASLKSAAVGMKALGGVPIAAIGKASLILGVLTAAIIGLGFALKIAAPGIRAFGDVMLNVFNGIATVLEKVYSGIAKVIATIGNAIRGDEVGKIKAESEAHQASVKATTNAIKELDGSVDANGLMLMAQGVDHLGDALGNFAGKMSPSMLSSIRSGFADLIGQDSPIQAVIGMSEDADPVKIMDLAKATMATNAANSGATALDPTLQQGSTTLNTNNNTSTVNNTTNTFANSDMKEALEMVYATNQAQNDLIKRTNRLLSEINNKTG